MNGCSGLMQRYLVESIFISVDIAVKEGQLFCDSICCQGVIRNSQVSLFLLFFFIYLLQLEAVCMD